MRKVNSISNQSVFDIAIQECGSVLAVFDIAQINNISVTDRLVPGMELIIPVSEHSNGDVLNYFNGKNKKIATATTETQSMNESYVLPGLLPMIL